MEGCIFCEREEILCENELAMAFYDKFPVNQGHVLIVPKRHVETFFDANMEEITAMNELAFEVKKILEQEFQPDGYNIGINVGNPAGQTIFHLHMHEFPGIKGILLIPGEVSGISSPTWCLMMNKCYYL